MSTCFKPVHLGGGSFVRYVWSTSAHKVPVYYRILQSTYSFTTFFSFAAFFWWGISYYPVHLTVDLVSDLLDVRQNVKCLFTVDILWHINIRHEESDCNMCGPPYSQEHSFCRRPKSHSCMSPLHTGWKLLFGEPAFKLSVTICVRTWYTQSTCMLV